MKSHLYNANNMKIISVDFLKIEKCACIFLKSGVIKKVYLLKLTTYENGDTVFFPITYNSCSSIEPISTQYEDEGYHLVFDKVGYYEVKEMLKRQIKDCDENTTFEEIIRDIKDSGLELMDI